MKKIWQWLKSRNVQKYIRTVLLALSLINDALQAVGVIEFESADAATVYRIISYVATAGAAAWAWWKNNSFTDAAIKADEMLDDLKKGGEDA